MASMTSRQEDDMLRREYHGEPGDAARLAEILGVKTNTIHAKVVGLKLTRTYRQRHEWTDDELDVLRRGYDGTKASTHRLAATVGVSYSQAQNKLAEMGLLCVRDGEHRPWTEAEDRQLCDMVERKGLRHIAAKLNRSQTAVAVRAKRMRLSRRVRDGWFTKREVCELFGVDHKWVQRRIDSGDLKAAPNNTRPQQEGGGYWRIPARSVMEYALEHTDELTGRNVDLGTLLYLVAGKLS